LKKKGKRKKRAEANAEKMSGDFGEALTGECGEGSEGERQKQKKKEGEVVGGNMVMIKGGNINFDLYLKGQKVQNVLYDSFIVLFIHFNEKGSKIFFTA
jgi:hypothetical protein